MTFPLRVLVGCERSGTVRDAFLRLGHDAWSCDLAADERRSNRHIRDDVRRVMHDHPWDIVCVMHPPCTRLCGSGVRWLSVPPPGRTREEMWRELDEGCALFQDCLDAPAPFVAVENPVMHGHAKERINFEGTENFYVQPWWFADSDDSLDNEKKRTGFWVRNLPKLEATGSVDGTTARNRVHFARPGKDRAVERSRFFTGMAEAMAEQWSAHVLACMGHAGIAA
ncbi:hypothetical protein [Poseidonocella sp. HB161398]|uniref:hypothetical protein n=1 Tax=Poseidonocella sp. HB161398 TaxID=2320855 RepID=UPI001109787B|nr:hypothetical protein [Poseidonocella sp. HB161398]